jgi:hypothetical protein
MNFKRTMAILLIFLFVVSLTSKAVCAGKAKSSSQVAISSSTVTGMTASGITNAAR